MFTLNLSSKFRDDVIHYFHDDYLGGRTPNPCMVCNKKIKWFGLFEGLKLLDADFVATGHFAATDFSNGRYRLYKGADPEKDQSYFLWMLSQNDLAKTLFPLGQLTVDARTDGSSGRSEDPSGEHHCRDPERQNQRGRTRRRRIEFARHATGAEGFATGFDRLPHGPGEATGRGF